MSPVRTHSLWVGLCPEKLVKQFIDETGDFVARVRLYVIIKAILSLKTIIWQRAFYLIKEGWVSYPRTNTQIHTPTVVQGGLMEPLPRVIDMLQYFETILPSVETLWSSLQYEVYIMGGGAAGGLWRHQQW